MQGRSWNNDLWTPSCQSRPDTTASTLCFFQPRIHENSSSFVAQMSIVLDQEAIPFLRVTKAKMVIPCFKACRATILCRTTKNHRKILYGKSCSYQPSPGKGGNSKKLMPIQWTQGLLPWPRDLRCCFASDKVPKNPENKTGIQNSYKSQLQLKAYTVKVIQIWSAGWDGCQCDNSQAFQEYPFNNVNHIAFCELHYIQYILGWPLEVRKQHIAALSSNNIAEIRNLPSLKATQDQTQPT